MDITGTRVYNGLTSMDGTLFTVTNLIGSDLLELSGSSTTDTPNVGTYTVNGGNPNNLDITGLTLGGVSSGNYTLVAATGNGIITPLPVDITATRQYNGLTGIDGTLFTVTNLVIGDNLNLTGSATADSKNVGLYTIGEIPPDGLALSTLSLGGSSALNYTLANATGQATITPVNIILTGIKVYDGTNIFDPFTFGNSGEIDTGIGTETLVVTDGPGSVPSRNAGPTQTLTLDSLGLGDGANGGLASNYQFASTGHTGTITPADLYLIASDDRKSYDGTTISTGIVTYSGLFDPDGISNLTQSFDSKNAGPRTISVDRGYIIADGNGGNNYVVTQIDAIGQIDRANITITTDNTSKTYDSTLIAPGNPTVSSGTLYPGDNPSGGTFLYTDPNFGQGNRTVVVSNVTVGDGINNNNYIISYVDNTNSSIEKATLKINPDVTKIFDGTTNATVNDFGVTGLIGNQTIVVNYTQAQFKDQNAGVDKPVKIEGISLTDGNNGGLAENYYVSPISVVTSKGEILQAILNITAVSDNKYYDGNTVSNRSPLVSGLVSGDSVTNLNQRFDNPQPGTRQLYVNSGYVVNDGNGGKNYTYNIANAVGEILIQPVNAEFIDIEIEPKYGYRYKYNSSGENPLKYNLAELQQVSSTLTIDGNGDLYISGEGNASFTKNSALSRQCFTPSEMGIANNELKCDFTQFRRGSTQAEPSSVTINAPTRPTAY